MSDKASKWWHAGTAVEVIGIVLIILVLLPFVWEYGRNALTDRADDLAVQSEALVEIEQLGQKIDALQSNVEQISDQQIKDEETFQDYIGRVAK